MKQFILLLFGLLSTTALIGQERVLESYFASNPYYFHSGLEEELVKKHQSSIAIPLSTLMLAVSESDANQVREQKEVLDKFMTKLEDVKHSTKSTSKFLNKVFYKTHRKFLKHYQPYSSLNDVVKSGYYDCLSATVLYALLLDHLKMEYKIIETNYHIYMEVYDGNKKFLFETTDPFTGFVSNQNKVAELVAKYNENMPLEEDNNSTEESLHLFNFDLNKQVQIQELPGLIYYNMAIVEFNNGHALKAVQNLDKARIFYNSDRIDEIMQLCFSQMPLDVIFDKSQYIVSNQ